MREDPRRDFIDTRKEQMRPTSTDPELFGEIARGEPVGEERLDAALETFETKVFTYERPDAPADAVRVLVESAQPANYGIVKALAGSLERDPHCGGFTLLTDNVSGVRFSAEKDALALRQVRMGEDVFADIPAGPYASALFLYEPADSPAPMLRHSAKGVFGAKKLFYFSPGLFDEKARDTFSAESGALEEIDGICVADDFAKQLFCGALHIPEGRVTVTGSPLIDAVHPEQADALRASGRNKLGISDEEIIVHYSTIPSSQFVPVGGSPDLNRAASDETLSGLIEAARANPMQKFALLARMHPRAKGVERLPEAVAGTPPNLRIVVGDEPSYDETVYASDVICAAPFSTEVMLAAYRGRSAAFLSYPGKGGVGELAERMYGREGMDTMEHSGRVRIVRSGHELAELLSRDVRQAPLPKPAGNSTERLAGILVGNTV